MNKRSDEFYMALAIKEGKKTQGLTGDNPYVGALLVQDSIIIGSGFTQKPGQFHAEQKAIYGAKSKKIDLNGAIIYCTVEPYSFKGRTEFCAKLIVEVGIRTCVFGIFDPHPYVNGRGKAMLEENGIEVRHGVMKNEVEKYLSDWLKNIN